MTSEISECTGNADSLQSATALLQSGTKVIKTAMETALDKVLQDVLKESRDTDCNLAMA